MRLSESPLAPIGQLLFIVAALLCAACFAALIPFAWLYDWLREDR